MNLDKAPGGGGVGLPYEIDGDACRLECAKILSRQGLVREDIEKIKF